MSITVVSTGYNAPTKQRCIDSVRSQGRHIYVEASEQKPPRTVTENVHYVVNNLDSDEIVAWLDGDDELIPGALDVVQRKYDEGADCTYGSFRFSDGRVPKLKAYDNWKNCRREEWLGTHLKTFRASLLQDVKPSELQINGQWIEMACDIAIMFAVLERAQRAVFCPEVLCVYNYANAWEHRMTTAEQARERDIVRVLRSR